MSYFIAHLDEYQAISPAVKHHTATQASFLAGRRDYLDDVIAIENLHLVEKILRARRSTVRLGKLQTGGPELRSCHLSSASRSRLVAKYSADYELLSDFYDPSGS